MTTLSSTAVVATAHGSQYLTQLCKHWAHNLPVDLTHGHGVVTFPKDLRGASYPDDAEAIFAADERELAIRIDASSQEQLDLLKDVVARHLDRFAFREAPLAYNWS